MENRSSSGVFAVRLYLLLVTAEGLFALSLLLRLPSKETNAFLWGYSLSRLSLAALASFIVVILAVITLRAFLDRQWLLRWEQSADDWLAGENRLHDAVIGLAFLSVAGLIFLLFLNSPLAINLDTLRAIYQRAYGLFIWAWAIAAQSLALLVLLFYKVISKAGFFQRARVWSILLGLTITALTIFHWSILVFREAIFTAIKGWYWQFHAKGFHPRDVIFLGMLILALCSIALVRRRLFNSAGSLLFLITVGYILQVGFGFIHGKGYEFLREKYADSSYKHYAMHASDRPPILYALSHYEEKYGRSFSLKTKPPGALLTYLVAQRITDVFSPENTFDGRFLRLTRFGAYVFPLLAMLALMPLAVIARRLLGEEASTLPLFFYIVCPNVLLITLVLDQFLYPLLFTIGVLAAILAVKKNSFFLAVVTGGLIYVVVFFSFSLSPLVFISASLIALPLWQDEQRERWLAGLKLVLGVALGLALVYLAFRVLLDYDFFTRYGNALAAHRQHKKFAADLGGIVKALFINNVEFSLWTGVPLVVLAFAQSIRSITAFVKKRASDLDWVVVAFVLTYLATNLLGQTRSEVGRLWLFMVPGVALSAAPMVCKLGEKGGKGVYFIAILQLVTAFLTYKFQDFY